MDAGNEMVLFLGVTNAFEEGGIWIGFTCFTITR